MWNTFKAMLLINLREKSGLFWLICFPVLLAALVQGVFGGIDAHNAIETVPVSVVRDEQWNRAYGAQQFTEALSATATTSASDESDSDQQSIALIKVTEASDRMAADALLKCGEVKAILAADNEGFIILTVSDTVASAVSSANTSGGDAASITISALSNVIDAFNVNSGIVTDAVTEALAAHPQLAQDPAFWQQFSSNVNLAFGGGQTYTKDVALTHFKPESMARYHFALLGMAAMLSMLYTCIGLTLLQPNQTVSGIRVVVSPLPKSSMVLGVFLSGWLMSFLSLTVAFLFIRFALGISVGGRELLAEIGILIATFVSSAMGLLLGAIPRLSFGVKNGISIALSTGLSMLAGLMGAFSMQLNDAIQANAPIVHLISPVKQVSNLFYDLLYYDSLIPFLQTIAILLTMSIVSLIAAAAILRRQRYEHL